MIVSNWKNIHCEGNIVSNETDKDSDWVVSGWSTVIELDKLADGLLKPSYKVWLLIGLKVDDEFDGSFDNSAYVFSISFELGTGIGDGDFFCEVVTERLISGVKVRFVVVSCGLDDSSDDILSFRGWAPGLGNRAAGFLKAEILLAPCWRKCAAIASRAFDISFWGWELSSPRSTGGFLTLESFCTFCWLKWAAKTLRALDISFWGWELVSVGTGGGGGFLKFELLFTFCWLKWAALVSRAEDISFWVWLVGEGKGTGGFIKPEVLFAPVCR